jgi:hypothetical protein
MSALPRGRPTTPHWKSHPLVLEANDGQVKVQTSQFAEKTPGPFLTLRGFAATPHTRTLGTASLQRRFSQPPAKKNAPLVPFQRMSRSLMMRVDDRETQR